MSNIACNECFQNFGLSILVMMSGDKSDEACQNCLVTDSVKIDESTLKEIAYRFFVKGTTQKLKFGSAPILEINDSDREQENFCNDASILRDGHLIEKLCKIRIFRYGPSLWKLGHIEPLKKLQQPQEGLEVIKEILKKFPTTILTEKDYFFRLRKNPKIPNEQREYDSPPLEAVNNNDNRIVIPEQTILYASYAPEATLHECRTTIEDELYIATLGAKDSLKLLDLSAQIEEEEKTEFESLALAVSFLFKAGSDSYKIISSIASHALERGFDGIIYPSYFNQAMLGLDLDNASFGLVRRLHIKDYSNYIDSIMIRNIAIFGSPISDDKVIVHEINSIKIESIKYEYTFGPVIT